ncbi:unnamed protein product [Victoria cruziana]
MLMMDSKGTQLCLSLSLPNNAVAPSMAIIRWTLITLLAISLSLQTTLAAAAPASSSKIYAFPLERLEDFGVSCIEFTRNLTGNAADSIAEAKRRSLKGGGGRGSGGRGFGSRGNRYRGGGARDIGSRGFRGRGIGYHARSAAVSLDHNLGMLISAVSVSSLIICLSGVASN